MKSQRMRSHIYEALFVLLCIVVLVVMMILQFGLLGR